MSESNLSKTGSVKRSSEDSFHPSVVSSVQPFPVTGVIWPPATASIWRWYMPWTGVCPKIRLPAALPHWVSASWCIPGASYLCLFLWCVYNDFSLDRFSLIRWPPLCLGVVDLVNIALCIARSFLVFSHHCRTLMLSVCWRMMVALQLVTLASSGLIQRLQIFGWIDR